MALEDLTGFNILFVGGTASPATGEDEFITALENASATVTYIEDTDFDSGDDSGQDLVIISASSSSSSVAGIIGAFTIPVITAEAFHWDNDDLADTPDFTANEDDITITDDTHPIAVNASVSNGSLTVLAFPTGSNLYHATNLGSGADVIAEKDSEPCLFVYEQGADLVTGTADGMRICVFAPDGWYVPMNAAGEALMEACVNYALGLLSTADVDVSGALTAEPATIAAAASKVLLYDLTGLDILLVHGDTVSPSPSAGEQILHDRLEAAGATVDFIDDAVVTDTSADAYDLFIVSQSSSSASLGGTLAGSATPGIFADALSYADNDLATGESVLFTMTNTFVSNPSHSVAAFAGLAAGDTAMYETDSFSGTNQASGTFGSGVVEITRPSSGSSSKHLFLYEAGDAMVGGGGAPARRAGGYWNHRWHNPDSAAPTVAGEALLDATINWALGFLEDVSGALTAEPAVMAGAAEVLHAVSGALTAEPAVAAGTAEVLHAVSGALTTEPAVMAGVSVVEGVDVSGALTAEPAVLAGAAEVLHAVSGAILAAPAAIAGSATVVFVPAGGAAGGAAAAVRGGRRFAGAGLSRRMED